MRITIDPGPEYQWCFPRVSGDEPESAYTAQLIITFSPRERG